MRRDKGVSQHYCSNHIAIHKRIKPTHCTSNLHIGICQLHINFVKGEKNHLESFKNYQCPEVVILLAWSRHWMWHFYKVPSMILSTA